MLQQTQVSRVVDYYARFLERFPTLHHVAQAPIGRVLEQWEGLGYYARARNLHRLAQAVAPDGQPNSAIPSDTAALRALPGIGAYTAGAIATFAYEKRAALVDTNVSRVLLRIFAPEFSPKSAVGQRVAWALAEATLPPRGGKAAWEHNQGLMELGALVCGARAARCEGCPQGGNCEARATGAAPASI
jgi:A/G-specific adenine glycosylase